MRKRRNSGEGHESSTGIDLAPMLDFVINLLIFFIITAVFVRESGITVERPTSAPDDSHKLAQTVQIDADGEIWVDGRLVDLRAVRANIERFRAEEPDSGVVIVAQRQSPTGTLVAVVDQIHLGGIHDITFSTVQ